GRRDERTRWKNVIGRDVPQAIQAARRRDTDVRTLYLGDSVARQLFKPGEEPSDDVRYVTSNFAVALAGQFYLMDDALRSCPDARDVNLVMVVGAWGNDLDSVCTDDYFCGYFHARGVRLRILPGPCPDTYRFTDTEHLYDADIFYVDHTKFSDGVHLRPEYMSEVRAELLRAFGINK